MNRFYENAPIVEAVIDIHVDNESVSEESFDQFAESVKARYEKKSRVNETQVQFNVPSGDFKQDVRNVGYRFVGEQADKVLMAKVKGFTFSNLPKYGGWEKFSSEARENWINYVKFINPRAVRRIAVRYINKINIPTEKGIKFEDYFNIYPEVADEVSPSLVGAYMQLKLPQPDLGKNYASVINLATAEPDEPKVVTIILDIDVFATVEMDPSDEEIWDVLGKLRHKKNKIFEASIKDSIRELIE